MYYRNTSELPEAIRNSLPRESHAEYLKLFNDFWDKYKNLEEKHGKKAREEAAHRLAWEALNEKLRKK